MSTSSNWYSSSGLAWGGAVAVALLLCVLGYKLMRRFKQSNEKDSSSRDDVARILDEALQENPDFTRVSPLSKNGKKDTRVEDILADFLPQLEEKELPNVEVSDDDVIEVEIIAEQSLLLLPSVEDYGTVIDRVESDNLRDLIKDRIADLNIKGLSVEQWALSVIDFMDEISWMSNSLTANDSGKLKELVKRLKNLLSSMDCEAIDDDEWTPERQRAVSVKKILPTGAYPRITKKGATGLIVRGCLVRKQEVYLETAPSN